MEVYDKTQRFRIVFTSLYTNTHWYLLLL